MDVKGTYVNYVQYGNETGKDIVLLHGWGQNIEMMDPIGKSMESKFRITIIDFPGFGKSPEPPYGFSVFDYYEVLDELLENLNIKEPILIGHSFGGRIAIIYAVNKKVSKLVLMGTPFRRTNKKANYKLKILKIVRKTPIIKNFEGYLRSKIASNDYHNASPIMRRVLVNVINQELTDLIPKIKFPTILIWGSDDKEVPISEAKYIEDKVKDCGLIIYEGCSHFAYLERLNQTINILNCFLKDE